MAISKVHRLTITFLLELYSCTHLSGTLLEPSVFSNIVDTPACAMDLWGAVWEGMLEGPESRAFVGVLQGISVLWQGGWAPVDVT